ncbi:MAG: sigma-70 family RNA polymerase sigma factor [Oscillospiraceae bacterium]|nr:sigma-70 family RNA polymerase sigma factor [Oscillospiraceae bacterium]
MNSLKSDRFIEENMGLVHLCANRFRNKGIEYDDLYSAGCIGLIKAAGAFDTERGVKFSTYAVPVILGEIKRLFRDGGTVKVSRSLKELSLRLMRIKDDFQLRNGREPTIDELCEASEENYEDVVEALASAMPALSLTGYSDENDTTQIDIAVDPPDNMMTELLSLHQAIDILEKDDKMLIFLRYYKDMTQTETAKILGMSQVQVSRREKKLLLKMRSFLSD